MRYLYSLAMILAVSSLYSMQKISQEKLSEGLTNRRLAVMLDLHDDENLISILQQDIPLSGDNISITSALMNAIQDASYPIVASTSLVNNLAWAYLARRTIESKPLKKQISALIGAETADKLFAFGKEIDGMQMLHEANSEVHEWINQNAIEPTPDVQRLADINHITKQSLTELQLVIEKVEPLLQATAIEGGVGDILYFGEKTSQERAFSTAREKNAIAGYAYAAWIWESSSKKDWIIREIAPGLLLLVPAHLKAAYANDLWIDKFAGPAKETSLSGQLLFKAVKEKNADDETSLDTVQALLNVFKKSAKAAWSIFLLGHGASQTNSHAASFAGLKEHEIAQLLEGFNRLNVKFMYIDTCFAANESFARVAYTPEHMSKTFLEPSGQSNTRFTLAVAASTENIVTILSENTFWWLHGMTDASVSPLQHFFESTEEAFGSSLIYFSKALDGLYAPLEEVLPGYIYALEVVIKQLLTSFERIKDKADSIKDKRLQQEWEKVESSMAILQKALEAKRIRAEKVTEKNLNWPMIRLANLDYFQLATTDKGSVQELSKVRAQQTPEHGLIRFRQPLIMLRATDMPFTTSIEPSVNLIVSASLKPTVYHFKKIEVWFGLYQLVHKFTTGASSTKSEESLRRTPKQELGLVNTRTPALFVIDELSTLPKSFHAPEMTSIDASKTELYKNVIIALNWPSLTDPSEKIIPFVSYERESDGKRIDGYLADSASGNDYKFPFARERPHGYMLMRPDRRSDGYAMQLIEQVLAALEKGSIGQGRLE